MVFKLTVLALAIALLLSPVAHAAKSLLGTYTPLTTEQSSNPATVNETGGIQTVMQKVVYYVPFIHHPKPSPEPFVCKENDTDISSIIRQYILDAKPEEISTAMYEYCSEQNLARGFDSEGSEDMLVKTDDRYNDPDIVGFKGFAYAAINYSIYEKLANIFLYALFGNDLMTIDANVEYTCGTADIATHVEYLNETKKYSQSCRVIDPVKTEVEIEQWDAETDCMWELKTSGIKKASGKASYGSYRWTSVAKVICKENVTEFERPLTEEELAELRADLIKDFSDTEYMQSIIDNSYFAAKYGRRRLLNRILLAAQANSVNSVLCNNCDPCETCKKQVSHCTTC